MENLAQLITLTLLCPMTSVITIKISQYFEVINKISHTEVFFLKKVNLKKQSFCCTLPKMPILREKNPIRPFFARPYQWCNLHLSACVKEEKNSSLRILIIKLTVTKSSNLPIGHPN